MRGLVIGTLLSGLLAGGALSCGGGDAADDGGAGAGAPDSGAAARKPDAGAKGVGEGAEEGTAGEPGGPALPETPRLPSELRIEVDGVALTAARAEELLQSDWASWVDGPQARAAAADGGGLLAAYFADPRARCAGLLAETAITREAARRFPELDRDELARQRERLRAGGRLAWFETVHGADAADAFVARFERRRLLEEQFAALSEEVPEEEVFAVYEETILKDLPPAAEREGLDVSFASHGPRIRERLQHARGLADLQAWAAAQAAGMKLAVILPDGTRLE